MATSARLSLRDGQHQLTGVERKMGENEIIVSKTDQRGIITYANKVFLGISGYSEDEVLDAPHSLIRHPDMPRCVFKLLWDTVKDGEEIFAYVVNRCKNGDHYWVFAHVTPCYDTNGQLIGYHSSRRAPQRKALEVIEPLYANLRQLEQQADSSMAGLEKSYTALQQILRENDTSYAKFVLSL